MNVDHRLGSLRRRMADGEAEAFLITDLANMRYMTGFEGVLDDSPNAACLVSSEWTRFYTDGRYEEAAREAAEGTPWVVHVTQQSLYIEMCRQLAEEGVASLAVEASVPYGRFRFISEQFTGRILVVDQWVEQLRQVKTSRELERIEAAARLADDAMEYAVSLVKPGMTERHMALELEVFMRTGGSEGVAFPVIVASGPNSARPHAIPSEREFEVGDLVVVDLGARIGDYCSDLTRTFGVGRVPEESRRIYAAVLEANEAALAGVRPGMRGSEIHALAGDVITKHGFGERFTHGLGHGVGLEVHELPRVSSAADESVPGGAVITIEPGVYVPGVGGVRIEDLVVVEDGSARLLSHAPKTLMEVGTSD